MNSILDESRTYEYLFFEKIEFWKIHFGGDEHHFSKIIKYIAGAGAKLLVSYGILKGKVYCSMLHVDFEVIFTSMHLK